MKKLINQPASVVEEMVEGLVAVYPGLRRLVGQTVVVRAEIPDRTLRRVAVISGGGSGHEPAHAGYVGRGMLSAAVAGDVFTSPSPDAVVAAIRATAGPAGVLLIIKNYTGDRLNFGLAAELARAEGISVETVLVADDVALAASPGSTRSPAPWRSRARTWLRSLRQRAPRPVRCAPWAWPSRPAPSLRPAIPASHLATRKSNWGWEFTASPECAADRWSRPMFWSIACSPPSSPIWLWPPAPVSCC